jgi:hypothetical protein
MVQLKLAVTDYHCEECYRETGRFVEALVRMMPRAAIVFGELVGEEWWGCPVCHREKFPVKKRAATKRKTPKCEATNGRGSAVSL